MNKNKENELEFQKDLIQALKENGWKNLNKDVETVLDSCTIEDLWNNFFKIVYHNNKDKLNFIDLSTDEKEQLKERIKQCNNAVEANRLINSETILIKRDNINDKENFGKEIYLKIFSRKAINSGDSIYQIAQQVKLPWKSVNRNHVADIILLINGLPLFHIELKRKEYDLSNAISQIKNYIVSDGFDEILKLVQVSVVMSPNEMKYMPTDFSGKSVNNQSFNYWHDDRNNIVKDWRDVTKYFLSIPMAHRLIADFTVCQENEKSLLILRSYQFHAIDKIEKKFKTDKKIFNDPLRTGCAKIGHIWHSTGSGKTLTSFKLSQLLLEWNIADTVVFVVDRTELGSQSFSEFTNFKGSKVNVKIASTTDNLVSLMKEENLINTIIVGSIQKQSRVNNNNFSAKQINKITNQKIVFIFDEAHRSTSGEMIKNINETFPDAAIIGFTGTPLGRENSKNGLTTKEIFGDLLHSYTLLNGIQDKKILDFNIIYKVFDKYTADAISFVNSSSVPYNLVKKAVYNLAHFRDLSEVEKEANRNIEENLLKNGYYDDIRFKRLVVQDILNNQEYFLDNKKYSAILAVKSIPDAIKYFELFKEECEKNIKYKDFKFTTLFDQSLDREEDLSNSEYKASAINNIIERYNNDFNTVIRNTDNVQFKADLSKRLSQKGQFINIENSEKLQLLIVVNQMLTGFDSKYINTIYFDKVMEYEHLIQAISRTNRTLPNKDFGNVIFYRQPNTMNYNLEQSLKMYADINIDTILTLSFEERLEDINNKFNKVEQIFSWYNQNWFESIPEVKLTDNRFFEYSKNMKEAYFHINKIVNDLRSARIMGFDWERAKNEDDICNKIQFKEEDFDALIARSEDIKHYFKKIESQKEIKEINKTKNNEVEFQNLSTEYSVYNENIKLNIVRLQEIINNERTREHIGKEISKFTREHQKILWEILEPYFNNEKNWDYLDIAHEFAEAISDKNNKIISDFCNEWELDFKKINNIIKSTETINVNNRLEDLCKNSFPIIREKLAIKRNKSPKKTLLAEFTTMVEEWIEEQKEIK
ncbi:HsdR family type I site-specific deoxyribonuclease [Metamycoplasma canadense]|uniref:Type I restriction enzyme endonuclease subunit n=1 Tax=Metamycoplasma canadense TaxID=29554 RepID=A0A077LAT8_9BACT|nr:HsdR family type I site-specific deoxyribonuclease [Metamycoplasma canadense]BAP39319.1 type I restriction modification system endonuclease (R) subunit, HsdR [Metamycoplasma canadense]